MRQLTASQLEQELQVGTVDLSEVEIVLELGETVEESEQTQESAIASALTGVAQSDPPEKADAPVSFEDVLKAQAAKALETIPADTRAATAVDVANTEEIEEAGNPQG